MKYFAAYFRAILLYTLSSTMLISSCDTCYVTNLIHIFNIKKLTSSHHVLHDMFWHLFHDTSWTCTFWQLSSFLGSFVPFSWHSELRQTLTIIVTISEFCFAILLNTYEVIFIDICWRLSIMNLQVLHPQHVKHVLLLAQEPPPVTKCKTLVVFSVRT